MVLKRIARKLLSFTTPRGPIEVEKREYHFYVDYLKEGMTVFDVGANIGELTLLYSKFVGEKGAVHSFEPCVKTFEKLNLISKISNRPQIKLNNMALYSKVQEVTLNTYGDDLSAWNTIADRKVGTVVNTEKMMAYTVDEYCKQNKIDTIDLLKVDVEGAEYDVLLGAEQMFRNKKIKCCAFETGGTTFDMGSSPEMIINYLQRFGYAVNSFAFKKFTSTSKNQSCFNMYIAKT